MIFFKDCSRRNLRSVSSSRLQKLHDKSPTVSRKFLYVGDEPKKIDKIIQRSTTPERSETPTVNYFRNDFQPRPVSGVNSRKRLESQYKSSFKRRVFKENPQSTRYFTNLFIEQLVSVPICERKNQNQLKKSISKQKITNKIDIYQKFNKQKGTMTDLNEADKLIIYCDPFTIEETESICSPIKPKYL
jgi:hypothetical protein